MGTSVLQIIDSQEKQFAAVCTTPGIEFEREKGFALQILGGNDYLTKIALNNPQSLINAITNVAAIGISLNPASKLAYLVPRKGGVCLDVSYMGMMHIAQQCGAIQWGQSIIVRETDDFELQPVGMAPLHKYNPFGDDRGKIVGCYTVVKTDTGDFLTNAVPISKIEAVRDRSEAWKSFKAKGTPCPWSTDEEEMIKKTVVKNAAKYWPRRERLDQAVHYMNTDGGEGMALVQNGQQEKNITPASANQQIDIGTILRDTGKTFADLNRYFTSKKFNPMPESPADLTEEQATAVLAFIQKRAA